MDRTAVFARALGDAQARRRLEILRLVGRDGSISQAARSAGVSYKAAWQAVRTLTELAGEPLVESSVGGVGGGGACLTDAGRRLLLAAEQLARVHERALKQAPGARGPAPVLTSMRNALHATVLRFESEGADDPGVRVVLALPAGAELASAVTRGSVSLLGLTVGTEVLALCKAAAVRIEPLTPERATVGGMNRLPGSTVRIIAGKARDEVAIALPDGQEVVGFATRPNDLCAGVDAQACIGEEAIVLTRRGQAGFPV